MSGGWPSRYALCNAVDNGTVTGSSIGTTLTASGTTNAKGSYVQLVASSSTDTDWMMVSINPQGGNLNSVAVDIAIGASGSESVLVNNLIAVTKNTQPITPVYMFPCSIPAGTRISARCQSSLSSATTLVQVTTFQSNFADGAASGLVDAVGFSTATTLGVAPTPGTNAQGSYSQVIASTANDYQGFFLGFDYQNNSAGSATYTHLLRLAIGASGSEQVILPNVPLNLPTNISNILTPANTPYIPMQIPAGTRIAVSDSVSATGGPTIGVTFYGVRA